jgi:hypothetical protein
MCTLTYVPRQEEVIITVNRDEAPSRAASDPIIREENGRQFWLAPEPVSGGSNFVLDIINQRLLVLLNGAFKPHKHEPPYRLSRGVMMIEAFGFDTLREMEGAYDFSGIEPFTLLSFQSGQWGELRWDGEKTHHAVPAADKSAIWSSTKLYPEEIVAQRQREFEEYISKSRAVYAQQMFEMHRRPTDDPRGIGYNMNFEDRVRTVSVTQLVVKNGRMLLRYLDLNREPKQILERIF